MLGGCCAEALGATAELGAAEDAVAGALVVGTGGLSFVEVMCRKRGANSQ